MKSESNDEKRQNGYIDWFLGDDGIRFRSEDGNMGRNHVDEQQPTTRGIDCKHFRQHEGLASFRIMGKEKDNKKNVHL